MNVGKGVMVGVPIACMVDIGVSVSEGIGCTVGEGTAVDGEPG